MRPLTAGVRPPGELKIITAILEQPEIEKILTHPGDGSAALLGARAGKPRLHFAD